MTGAVLGTSSSCEKMSCARIGRAGCTACQLGCGLPRQRLDNVHVALRSMDICQPMATTPSIMARIGTLGGGEGHA